RLELIEGTVIFASARTAGRRFVCFAEIRLNALRDFFSGFFRFFAVEHVILVVILRRRVHKPELDENRGQLRLLKYVNVRRLTPAIAESILLHYMRMNLLRELFPFGTAGIVVRFGSRTAARVPVERNENVGAFRIRFVAPSGEGWVVIPSGPNYGMPLSF